MARSLKPRARAWLGDADRLADANTREKALTAGRLIAAAEAVLTELEARPRLGTAQSLGAERLASRYPRFADVQRVRNRVDPDRRFGNDYLARVLGDGA